MDMQYSTVKWFDAKKGYGFIDHPDGGDDVFVHYSQIVSDDDFKTLRTGQTVKFEMNNGPKGLHAVNVEPQPDEEEEAAEEVGTDLGVSPEASSADPVPSEPPSTDPAADPAADPVAEEANIDPTDDDSLEDPWEEEYGDVGDYGEEDDASADPLYP